MRKHCARASSITVVRWHATPLAGTKSAEAQCRRFGSMGVTSLMALTLALTSACSSPQTVRNTATNASGLHTPNSKISHAVHLEPVTEILSGDQSDAALIPVAERPQLKMLPRAYSDERPSLRRIQFADNTGSDKTDPSLDLQNELSVDVWQMTVDESVEHAIFNHPMLRAQQFAIDAARARLVTANTFTNPQWVSDVETPVHEAGDRTEFTTRVTWAIPTFRKMDARRNVATAGIRRAQVEYAQQREQTRRSVIDAAVEVLYLQELLDINTSLSHLAQDRAEQYQQRTMADGIQSNIRGVDAQRAVFDTQTRLTSARSLLASTMGLDPQVVMKVKGTLVVDSTTLLPLDAALALARSRSASVDLAYARLDESQRQHRLARVEAVPDLEAGPRYQDRLGLDDDNIGVRISTDLPVFDKNRGAIMETCAQVNMNSVLLEAAEMLSPNNVAADYNELKSIRRQIIQHQEATVAPLIEQSINDLNDPAKRATISDDEEFDIRRRLLQLKLSGLGLRYRYHLLYSRLEAFLGQPLSESTDAEDVGKPRKLDSAVRSNNHGPLRAPKRLAQNRASRLKRPPGKLR